METLLSASQEQKRTWIIPSLQVMGGSIFLALISQLAIPLPFTPVPISMQTLGVFLLGMTLGSRKGCLAVLLYLAQGTMGLPVFAGGFINPLWMMGPKCGYFIGFAAAAYLIGKIREKNKSFFATLGALALGEIVILTLGASVLSLFVGLDKAFLLGVLPFLTGDLIKMVTALCLVKPLSKWC